MDATLTIIEPFVAQMGGSISALRAIMAECGWIDDHAIDTVAERFNLSRAEVKGIVSFYSDFRVEPPAARMIQVCQAEACQARGAQRLTTALESEAVIALDARDPGGTLELQSVHCLGLCAHGPVAREGDALYVGLSDADAGALISGTCEGYSIQDVGKLDVEPPEWLADQERLIFRRMGNADPLDLEAYCEAGGFQHVDLPSETILREIRESGLRGRGGAGFPASIKWDTVAAEPSQTKYLVCNADEGDSGTFADRLIMEQDPYLLLEGMALAARAVGASKGYIYLRSEYPRAALILREAISRWRACPELSQTLSIELFIGAGAYICGEETSLLESLEGKRGLIRAKPPLPAKEGLMGQPTLVHNVLTLCSVPWIVRQGGASYASFGEGASTGTMPFQLSGNVRHGGIIEIPFGLPLRALVERYGGGTLSGRPIGAIQVGGPLGAYLLPEAFDTPLTYEAMQAIGAGIGHGGIVVFDDQVDLLERARAAFEFCAIESCGKCTPCRLGATRGEELLKEIQRDGISEDRIRLLDDLCDVMERASLCQLGGMTPIPVRSALRPAIAAFESDNEVQGR